MRIQNPNKPPKNHSSSLNKKNKISLKLKLAEKSWLFSIVASLIGLVSLLTPILYSSEIYYGKRTAWIDIQEWIFGNYNVYIKVSPNITWSFEEFEPLPIHIITTTLIVISHFAILVIAAIKLKKKEQFASPYLIYFSIVTMLTVIGYVIYSWIYLVQPCEISPGFAVYGQFISGFFIFINYCLGKSNHVIERYKKTKTRDFTWTIPLVAGIFAIVAILLPTAIYGEGSWDWWMWNFVVSGDNSTSLFILDFIILSTITTSAVLLIGVNLLILSVRTKRRNLNTKNFESMLVISAVSSIGITIYYIIAMDIAFYDGITIDGTIFPAGYHFWEVFQPGFGVFLPFISVALSFIGVGLSRHYSKRKENIIPLKIDTI